MDMLEQMDLLDISDQEALDVFLASTEEDEACSCPLEGRNRQLTTRNADLLQNKQRKQQKNSLVIIIF